MASPHTFCPGCISPSEPPPQLTPTISWLLHWKIKWPPLKAEALPPSLFFCCSIWQPYRGHCIPPQVPPRSLLTFHCRHQLLFDCCVQFNKLRPPKAKAPLPSLFFDASHFAPPSKQTNSSAQALRLVTCIWRWGAAALWFGGAAALPRRERGRRPTGEGGRVAHLVVCGVCCVCLVCFVFCWL